MISHVHREYVKGGRISKELGRALLAAFDRRTQADYDDLVELLPEHVAETLEQARRFVAEVKILLQAT